MYASVRRAKSSPGSTAEIARRVEKEFVPIISGLPGFHEYYAIDAGNDVVVTVSIFHDRAGAEESNRRAAEWVKQALGSLLTTPLEFSTGEVVVHKAMQPARP